MRRRVRVRWRLGIPARGSHRPRCRRRGCGEHREGRGGRVCRSGETDRLRLEPAGLRWAQAGGQSTGAKRARCDRQRLRQRRAESPSARPAGRRPDHRAGKRLQRGCGPRSRRSSTCPVVVFDAKPSATKPGLVADVAHDSQEGALPGRRARGAARRQTGTLGIVISADDDELAQAGRRLRRGRAVGEPGHRVPHGANRPGRRTPTRRAASRDHADGHRGRCGHRLRHGRRLVLRHAPGGRDGDAAGGRRRRSGSSTSSATRPRSTSRASCSPPCCGTSPAPIRRRSRTSPPARSATPATSSTRRTAASALLQTEHMHRPRPGQAVDGRAAAGIADGSIEVPLDSDPGGGRRVLQVLSLSDERCGGRGIEARASPAAPRLRSTGEPDDTDRGGPATPRSSCSRSPRPSPACSRTTGI